MAEHTPASRSDRSASAREGVTLTVRLFARVHRALFADLVRVDRGLRGARAIHLMTRGLLAEEAGSRAPGEGGAALAPRGPANTEAADAGQTAAAPTWFVAAVLSDQQSETGR